MSNKGNSSSLPPNLKEGLLFVLSAPAGTGKTTLVKQLTDVMPRVIASISFTTRPPRTGEFNGIHYNFISREAFEAKIAAGDFLEYVEFCGNYYGTSLNWVEKQRADGKHVILTIDTQGALLLKEKLKASYIFILPPSLEIQRQRLILRGTDTPEVIEQRMLHTMVELKVAREYDYAIVNSKIDLAVATLKTIIEAEEYKVKHLLKDSSCPALLKIK
ncbi:MAG: guanylate kinase [Parachlamydiales bacterium]|jgi:guanylate kinase